MNKQRITFKELVYKKSFLIYGHHIYITCLFTQTKQISFYEKDRTSKETEVLILDLFQQTIVAYIEKSSSCRCDSDEKLNFFFLYLVWFLSLLNTITSKTNYENKRTTWVHSALKKRLSDKCSTIEKIKHSTVSFHSFKVFTDLDRFVALLCIRISTSFNFHYFSTISE